MFKNVSEFQFHKGTIRTGIFEPESCHIRYFNSIKVQLEHVACDQLVFDNGNFNSIKVQLELQKLPIRRLKRIFQFHKGTIRTFNCNLSILIIFHFNSIKVQLEQYDGLLLTNRCPISIP